MEHARYVLNKVKLALTLLVLENKWIAIEIDEDIKEARIFKEPICLEKDCLMSVMYTIDETTLFPIDPNLYYDNLGFAQLTALLKIDKLKNSIDKAFSLNDENIYDDEKLSLALEIYSKHSQFSRKRQFLDLVTILEILKPEYPVSSDSIHVIELIKQNLKSLRNGLKKDSEEYMEFDRYFNDIHYWMSKSINKSLQQFACEYKEEFDNYENIDSKIKKVYKIRSNIVHSGIIDEEFDEYYDFLKDFVGRLLRIKIINYN